MAKAKKDVVDVVADNAVVDNIEIEQVPEMVAVESSIPNETTQAAIAELEAGQGKRFATVDALMADLNDETYYVEPSEAQAIALLEQGAFDYCIQGVDAVLNSPYTEGSEENVFYTRGWNKAFDEANKA